MEQQQQQHLPLPMDEGKCEWTEVAQMNGAYQRPPIPPRPKQDSPYLAGWSVDNNVMVVPATKDPHTPTEGEYGYLLQERQQPRAPQTLAVVSSYQSRSQELTRMMDTIRAEQEELERGRLMHDVEVVKKRHSQDPPPHLQ